MKKVAAKYDFTQSLFHVGRNSESNAILQLRDHKLESLNVKQTTERVFTPSPKATLFHYTPIETSDE